MIATPQEQSCYTPVFGILANLDGMEGLESDTELIRALVTWSGANPTQLAKKAGVAVTTINRPHKATADTRLSQPTLDKLRSAFPTFPGWTTAQNDFHRATSPDDQAYVAVRILPSYAGAGGGGTGDGDIEIAYLPRILIEEQLRGRANDFELIDVRGDSMAPEFIHGDQILVDRDPIQPGAFALFDGDGYVIKKVERVPRRRGWYRVFSVNSQYSEYEIEEAETSILGRPVWFARRL
jgi:phage repressor protein C with HTH and peptisase S24 domain